MNSNLIKNIAKPLRNIHPVIMLNMIKIKHKKEDKKFKNLLEKIKNNKHN